MTCTVHHFPAPPAYVAQLEAEARRQAIVAAARAVLRSAEWQSDDDLILACTELQRWGDSTDFLGARIMLDAIRQRQKAEPRVKRIGADSIAVILGAAFALGMIAYVTAKARGWL